MKKTLTTISLICFLIISFICFFCISSTAAEESPERYWFCSQVGYFEEGKSLVISNISSDTKENNYSAREKAFEQIVQEEEEKFDGLPAQCRDYSSEKRADKYFKKFLKSAKKHGFSIIHIKFRY